MRGKKKRGERQKEEKEGHGRKKRSAWKAWIIASRAFSPSQGVAAAWVFRPLNSIFNVHRATVFPRIMSPGEGCTLEEFS